MNEPMVKIPGTTFYLQFGVEGKYYALFLIQGRQSIKSKKLDILYGTSTVELPTEMENRLKTLLEEENIYINPVVVDRVVNELLEQKEQQSQVLQKEKPEVERLVLGSIKVSELIKKSEDRTGKTSVVEYKPYEKQKYDATSDSIGHYSLRTPKSLPTREALEEQASSSMSLKTESIRMENVSSIKNPSLIVSEKYVQLEERIVTLTNQINTMQQKIDSTSQEITSLKKQVTTLKNKLKDTSQ